MQITLHDRSLRVCAGMRAVRSGEALAYLTDYSTLQYYQTNLDCKLLVCCSQLLSVNMALER